MAVNAVNPRRNFSTVTGRAPSPAIWADCPVAAILEDPSLGIYEFQDFLSGGLLTAPTTHAALVGLNLSGFSSSASQISYGNPTFTTSTEDRGTLVLEETTTRESTSVRSDVVPYRISANFGKLWFEQRFKVSTTATAEMSFFIGLMGADNLTVDIPVIAAGADTHLIASKNVVGFKKPVGDDPGTTFDCIYRADGQAAVVPNDGTGVLVANTYIKVGFVFDPSDNYLTYYINNVEQATRVAIPDNTGTSFPADVPLGWVTGMSVGTAASTNTLTTDWYRICQLTP